MFLYFLQFTVYRIELIATYNGVERGEEEVSSFSRERYIFRSVLFSGVFFISQRIGIKPIVEFDVTRALAEF